MTTRTSGRPPLGWLATIVAEIASIGLLVYVVGYVVLSSHHRVLGIRETSTDVSVLVANAWELLHRGVLVTISNVLDFPELMTSASVALTPTGQVLLLLSLVVLLLSLWPGLSHRRPRVHTSLRLAALTTALTLGVIHLLWNTASVLGVSSLLTQRVSPVRPLPGEVRPFGSLPTVLRVSLDERRKLIRSALLRDPSVGDARVLEHFFTWHLIVTAASFLVCLSARRDASSSQPSAYTRPTAASVLSRKLASIVFGFAVVHALAVPLLYGGLLKSYRYARVRLTLSKDQTADAHCCLPPYPFLLESTPVHLLLYRPDTERFLLIRQDAVSSVTTYAADFLFFKPSQGVMPP